MSRDGAENEGAGREDRSFLATSTRLMVSVAALAIVARRVDFGATSDALGEVGVGSFVLGFIAYLGSQLLSAIRWMLIVRTAGLDLGLARATKYYFIGMFFSVFAPSTIGGDVARTFYAARAGLDGVSAAATVLFDRVLGFYWLTMIAAIALASFEHASLPCALQWIVYGTAAAMSAGGVAMVVATRRARVSASSGPLSRAWRSVSPLCEDRALLLRGSVLSVLVQCVQILAVVVLVSTVAPQVHWSYCFVFQPLVAMLGAVPISLAGLGVRESGYVYFLATLRHVPAENAFGFALAWLATLALAAAVGALVYFGSREARPTRASRHSRHSGKDQLPSSS